MRGFSSIGVYAPDGVSAFGLGLAGEVFADRSSRGLPPFRMWVAADSPGAVRTDLGLSARVEHGLDRLSRADLVVLPPVGGPRPPSASAAAIRAIRSAHDRGAIVASHCVGAYLLADTGLLDNARATTHWLFTWHFAERYPAITVIPDVLYVDEGQILTSAGAAAGIDMYLHLIRREHGAAAASAIAREIVVAPHRQGGQAQYIPAPVPENVDDERLAAVMEWARTRLRRDLPVRVLAQRAWMSERTFARRFRAATGTTVHAWLINQRLDRAEELLETTDMSIEEVAVQVGYSAAAVLREQFAKRRGVPPRVYREAFRARPGPGFQNAGASE